MAVTDDAFAALSTRVTRLERTVFPAPDPPPPPPVGDHGYFDMLVARPDHWLSYSLRPDGLNPANLWVTHDTGLEAAKCVIPAFKPTTKLLAPISDSDTVIRPHDSRKAIWPGGRVVRIEEEVCAAVRWIGDGTVEIARAQFGTTAVSHGVDAPIAHASNSLPQQHRLPLVTEDGHRYFFTWEACWTESFRGLHLNHKAFQFASGADPDGAIWTEVTVDYRNNDASPYIAQVGTRFYNKVGGPPNWSESTGNELGPGPIVRTPFGVRSETWTRFFAYLDQRANDYDPYTLWVADPTRSPVAVVQDVPVSVRVTTKPQPNTVAKWWIELNSSTDTLQRTDMRDLVVYLRNFVALRDPINDVQSLLVQPLLVQP